MPIKPIRRSEGLFWVGVGAFVSILAWRAHFGSFREPGPGFVALASGLFICTVGLMMAFSETLLKSSERSPYSGSSFEAVPWPRLLFTLGLLIAYALLLNHLGYILATFLLMCGLFYGRGRMRLILSVLISLITVASSYIIFEVWLRCQLPRGIFP